MTLKEKDLEEKMIALIEEIEDYISSNSDWVYYFLNPLAGGNKELFDCMEEHPDNWEDYISFHIVSIINFNVSIIINILDETELGTELNRHIYLPTFAETVERNKKLYDGKLNEIRIENIESDIDRLKNLLQEKEEELKTLKVN